MGLQGQTEFIRFMHIYIGDTTDINKHKIVATPYSEPIYKDGLGTTSKFITLWAALTDEDKDEIRKKIRTFKGYNLGIHISENLRPANRVIIYASEYLEVLAAAAETSPEDILRIIEIEGPKTQEEMDIIQVAFGDKYKTLGQMDLSPTGEALEQIYLRACSKIYLF